MPAGEWTTCQQESGLHASRRVEAMLSYHFKQAIKTHATNSVVSQSLVCWLHERNEGYVGYMRGTRDMLAT